MVTKKNITLCLLALISAFVWVHNGRRDSNGGHVNRTTGEYQADVRSWSAATANCASVVVQMIKQSVNKIILAPDYSFMHIDVDQNLFARTTDDAAEAPCAYLTEKTPTFTGI